MAVQVGRGAVEVPGEPWHSSAISRLRVGLWAVTWPAGLFPDLSLLCNLPGGGYADEPRTGRRGSSTPRVSTAQQQWSCAPASAAEARCLLLCEGDAHWHDPPDPVTQSP